MNSMSDNGYKFLEVRPRSSLRQLWIKGRNIWAEVLYRETVGEDPRTPEQVAHDFRVPLEAVREAIDYCTHNADFLNDEREREYAQIAELEKRHPPLQPPKS
jgi:uncharacterized protein (DUF433 family)